MLHVLNRLLHFYHKIVQLYMLYLYLRQRQLKLPLKVMIPGFLSHSCSRINLAPYNIPGWEGKLGYLAIHATELTYTMCKTLKQPLGISKGTTLSCGALHTVLHESPELVATQIISDLQSASASTERWKACMRRQGIARASTGRAHGITRWQREAMESSSKKGLRRKSRGVHRKKFRKQELAFLR